MNFRLDFDGVPVILRPAGDDDHAFIVDSWVMSYRNQARARDAGAAYMRGHKRAIRACLKRAAIRVACLENEPGTILGYAVLEGSSPVVLQYVFVKREFRSAGIARALIADLIDGQPVTYTHRSWKTPPSFMRYDPYAFFNPEACDW